MADEESWPAWRKLQQDLTCAKSAVAVLQAVEHRHTEFDSRHVATALYRLALVRDEVEDMKQSQYPVATMATLLEMFQDIVLKEKMGARSLANAVWACSILSSAVPGIEAMAPVLAEAAILRLEEFSPQGISNCAWALARLDVTCDGREPESVEVRYWDATATRVCVLSKEFIGQQLSNLSWSLAVARSWNSDALQALAGSASRDKQVMSKPQQLANMTWAFGKLEERHSGLEKALARATLRRAPEFEARHLAISAWAFAQLKRDADEYNIPLACVLSKVAAKRIDAFSAQGLSLCAASLLLLVNRGRFMPVTAVKKVV